MTMQTWRVIGADKATGKDRVVEVEAGDEQQAQRRGGRLGLMVERVEVADVEVEVEDVGDERAGVVGYSRRSRRASGSGRSFAMSGLNVSSFAGVGLGALLVAFSLYQIVLAIIALIGGMIPAPAPDPDNPFAGLAAELQSDMSGVAAFAHVSVAVFAATPGVLLSLLGFGGLVAIRRLGSE
ncbi:MAG: hypothetical protein AAF561_00175 [Planctomycetota bacterium]